MSRPDQPEEGEQPNSSPVPCMLGNAQLAQMPKEAPLPSGVTRDMHQALHWLKEHGGSGVFTRSQSLLAQGETAPFLRSIWQQMIKSGLLAVEEHRVVFTQQAQEHCWRHPLATYGGPYHTGRVDPLPGADDQ